MEINSKSTKQEIMDADVKEIAVKAIENAGKVQMLTAKTENIKK